MNEHTPEQWIEYFVGQALQHNFVNEIHKDRMKNMFQACFLQGVMDGKKEHLTNYQKLAKIRQLLNELEFG